MKPTNIMKKIRFTKKVDFKKKRNTALTILAVVFIYCILPTTKTVELASATNVTDIDHTYRVKTFDYHENINLKEAMHSKWLPNINIPVYVSGKCYYSPSMRRAVIDIDRAYAVDQSWQSRILSFKTDTQETNGTTYVAQANVQVGYRFLPLPFKSFSFFPFSGHEEYHINCNTFGQMSSTMDYLY